MHVNNGKSAAKALKDRTDYGKNPEKTRNGELVTAYECDPITAAEEFLLTRRQYEQSTGRRQKHDVIAYQLRQSFKPGEVTAEEANQIGYETAMSFTKGDHAFFVATHIDKAHIHNHIYFNSTSLDGSRKFRNFFLSYKAIQQISDRICVQHGLSIVEPRPYREREKRTDYPKRPSFRDGICEAIDAALKQKPSDFEAFMRLLEADGYEIKRGKNISLKGKGQKGFIRMRSLGEGYSEAEIQAVLAGEKEHKLEKRKSGKKKQFSTEPPELQLLIDIEAKRAEGKGGGYVRWAKSFNLKQMAESICFVKEHEIGTYEELVEKTDAVVARFDELSASIKASEQRLAEIAALKKHILNYSKTKDTYVAYRKSGYSKKFLEEHRKEIAIHKAAKAAFSELEKKTVADSRASNAGGKGGLKIPTIKQLNQEYAEVLGGKKKAYTEYRTAREEMQEYLIARKNIEVILGLDEAQQGQKEMSQEAQNQRGQEQQKWQNQQSQLNR